MKVTPKIGETYLLRHFIAGRPSMARIVNNPDGDYLISMEGSDDKTGKLIKFTEHVDMFHRRWAKQLSIFENKKSKLAEKHLK